MRSVWLATWLMAGAVVGVAAALAGETDGVAVSERGPSPTPTETVPTDPVAEDGGEWAPNVRAAKRYARGRAGDVRFAVVDLQRRLRELKGARTAPMASLFKTMLLAAYLRQPSVRDRDLREWERDLLGPMIRRSANDPATRIRDMLGPRPIKRLAHDANMRDFSYHSIWGLSRTSSRDQARFFARWDRFVPKRHEHYARYLLSHIVSRQRWGIARARPNGWRIYFKGGWGVGTGRVNHQTAFLEKGRCRIAISVMTEFSPSHRYGTITQRGVAERLLDRINRAPCGDQFDTGGDASVSGAG